MNLFDNNTKRISIHPSILVWAFCLIAGVWIFWQIADIFLLLFLAIILSSALEPSIQKLTGWKLPRWLAITVLYIGLFAVILGTLAFLIPSLVRETGQVFASIPETLRVWGISDETIRMVTDEIKNMLQLDGTPDDAALLQHLFSTTVSVVRGGVGLLAVIAMSLYILAVDGGVEKFFRAMTPKKYQDYVVSRSMEAYQKTGRWLAGQVFLMGIVFLIYFILLSILGVPGAFALAVWGGVFEIVPYIGPTMAALPAVLLGSFVSPVVGILVLVSYIVVQKLENYWLVPKVMERAIGLHPLVIILVLLAGGQLAGFMGLLLSVPLATVASVFLRDAFEMKTE